MKIVLGALVGAVGSTVAQWRAVVLLWLANALLGWAISAPAAVVIEDTWLHAPEAPAMLAALPLASFVDFESNQSAALSASQAIAEHLALPWILLWTVLTAGVWARLAHRKEHPSLLAASGRYAHRFLWLAFVTLLALWGVAVVNDWLSGAVTDLLGRHAGPAVLGWTMHAKTLLVLGLAGLAVTASHVARLRIVHLGERLAPLSWLSAAWSVVRHLPSVGFARIASLAPLVLVLLLHAAAAERLLADDTLFLGLRTDWKMLLLFQLTQLLLHAALVYRMAVLARLWPVVAPAGPEPARAPAPAPATGDEPVARRAPDQSSPSPLEKPVPEPVTAAVPGGVAAGRGTAVRSPLALAASFTLLVALVAGLDRARAQDADPQPQRTADPQPEAQDASPAQDAPAPVPAAPGPAEPPPSLPQDATPEPGPSAGAGSTSRAVLRNEYVFDVTLDPDERTASATGQATFINATGRPVDELWLHLYPNAFASTGSLWMREAGVSAVVERGAEHGAFIAVHSLRLPDGTDLAPVTTIGAGATPEASDATLMRVALPRPVPAGGRVALQIAFTTRFPRIVARMGFTGEHLDGMQWFPKFCAHDDAGWHNDPFWRTGEFFADFGRYDVTFRWPETWGGGAAQLEATGVPSPVTGAGSGTLVQRFTASDVHDFAFCLDPHAVRYEDAWEDPLTGRRVELVYLCQPYATPKAAYVLEVLKSCLDRAAEWWMPYPWPRLVVDGLPHDQGGGMEYPMLFTISQRSPLHLGWLNDLVEDPASVTAHEFAHQYFYGVLASNEVDEAWLDEGFTTWATEKLLAAWRPPSPPAGALTLLEVRMRRAAADGGHAGKVPWVGSVLSLQQVVGWRTSPFHDQGRASLLGFRVPRLDELRLPGLDSDRFAWLKPGYARAARLHALDTPSRAFTEGYGGLVYRKTALVLETLERHVGEEVMRDLMRTYVQRFAFGHPGKDDFLGVASEITGGQYDALLAQLVESSGTVDFAVGGVSTRRLLPEAGYLPQQRPGDPVTYTAADEQPRAASAPLVERSWRRFFDAPFPGGAGRAGAGDTGAPASDAQGPWLTHYTVRQLGEVTAEVVVEARFEDGSVLRDVWDGRGGSRRYEHETPSRLVEVVVDPERLFALDLDVNNNGHRVPPSLHVTRTLEAAAHFWAQHHLAAWALAF